MSAMLSPLAKEVDFGSATEMTLPPSRCIADSKESRVRVLGSKKMVAITLPAHNPYCSGILSDISSEREKIDSISLLVRSSMVIKSLFFKSIFASLQSILIGFHRWWADNRDFIDAVGFLELHGN